MSIIRCEECEKMIDSDFIEMESIGDKEYCQECFEEILEAVTGFSKWFIEHVHNTGELIVKEEKRKNKGTLLYTNNIIKEGEMEEAFKKTADYIQNIKKEDFKKFIEEIKHKFNLKNCFKKSCQEPEMKDERKIKEGEVIIVDDPLGIDFEEKTKEEAFENLKKFSTTDSAYVEVGKIKLYNFLLRECEKQKDSRLKILAEQIYNPEHPKKYLNRMRDFREKIILNQWKLRNFLRTLKKY